MADDVKARGIAALAADDDHMIATGADLDWLIAQLACLPERVDAARTMNDRFLRMSAAATLTALRQPAPVWLDHPVIQFLLGHGPLEGRWFGDTVTGPAFWWRKHLRAALTPPPPAQETPHG